jgi:hypothetical protein
MTPFDDNDLIDRLQSGIDERQSRISAPDGIGDQARRAARKRTATRAVGAGVPVLAAAGVATVLAVSSGSGPTAVTGLSAGGVNGSALGSDGPRQGRGHRLHRQACEGQGRRQSRRHGHPRLQLRQRQRELGRVARQPRNDDR